jgi:hypothetical protein
VPPTAALAAVKEQLKCLRYVVSHN